MFRNHNADAGAGPVIRYLRWYEVILRVSHNVCTRFTVIFLPLFVVTFSIYPLILLMNVIDYYIRQAISSVPW